MLSIDRLSLRLPPGFEHRTADIARQVKERLEGLDGKGLGSTGTVSLAPVRISPGATDSEVAESIARAVADRLRRPT